MDYIQGLSEQTEIFLLSLGFGFLLGFIYDIFRTLRLIISRPSAFTVAADILYFLLCALLVFCFNLVVDSGKIRLYVLFGDMLGWFIYYFSLGEIISRFINKVVSCAKRVVSSLFCLFLRPAGYLERKTKKLISFFKKIIKKFNKKLKIDLQKQGSMVYNRNGYIENNTFKDK